MDSWERYYNDFYYENYRPSPSAALIFFELFIDSALFAFLFLFAEANSLGFEIWCWLFLASAIAILANAAFSAHTVRKGAVRCSMVKSMQKQNAYVRRHIPERQVDLLNYINYKANRNVFICGTSGQGKSRLARYLLDATENQKIIFNFKPNDEYLKLGYPIADMATALPNPFKDKEAFLNAYLITFPVQSLGITAEQIPALLREMAQASANWQEFQANLQNRLTNAKDNAQKGALIFIGNTVKSLAFGNSCYVEIGGESLVFDFSGLNADAKTFYAELMLRQLWHEITNEKRKGMVICIDEAHRLLRHFEKYESIYNEMAREIRAYGQLWTSTQNLSDMHESILDQFDTQFVFNTNGRQNLQALESTDRMLGWAVASMPLHVFTDARYPWIHAAVPEFCLYYKPEDREKVYYKGIKPEGGGGAGGGGNRIDYVGEIMGMLAKRAAYATEMGKLVARKHGISKDKAKLGVKEATKRLLEAGKIGSARMLKDGREVVFYYQKSPNASGLHRLMQHYAMELLRKKGIKAIAMEASASLPDIDAEGFAIEIETGLKHSIGDLKTRLIKAAKRTIILVPNDDVAMRYKGLEKPGTIDVVAIGNLDSFLDKKP